MDYTLKLDDYTVIKDDEIEEYNNLENKNKVKANINKFFNMINMGDYELAYELLDEEFRQNGFGTIEKFKEYINSKMFKHNKVKFTAYSSELSPIYVYKITLKDASDTNENAQTYNYKILVKLLENNKFIMSFSQE